MTDNFLSPLGNTQPPPLPLLPLHNLHNHFSFTQLFSILTLIAFSPSSVMNFSTSTLQNLHSNFNLNFFFNSLRLICRSSPAAHKVPLVSRDSALKCLEYVNLISLLRLHFHFTQALAATVASEEAIVVSDDEIGAGC